ncbi:hypothetical protein B4U79_19147 [Dinothrombium tinctorium]|uniref:Endonuclease/exonuclease/phosphatase domain-containing protein n=1 Tax=Dinothrombium tinctorium TaxID=1965070 RepID=A0A443QGA9_9ACAR|nr:hypothetical protein B4U79_19147 [Dinothrombium tinctorium]
MPKNEKGLKVMHLNVRSILTKIDEIKTIVNSIAPDIFCISETWLDAEIADFHIGLTGYEIERTDRHKRSGGGLVIFIKESRNFEFKTIKLDAQFEHICLELRFKNTKPLYLLLIYNPPNSTSFIENFEIAIQDFSLKELILIGDFNMDLFKEKFQKSWEKLLIGKGFIQYIKEATRITNESETLIDHIFFQ